MGRVPACGYRATRGSIQPDAAGYALGYVAPSSKHYGDAVWMFARYHPSSLPPLWHHTVGFLPTGHFGEQFVRLNDRFVEPSVGQLGPFRDVLDGLDSKQRF